MPDPSSAVYALVLVAVIVASAGGPALASPGDPSTLGDGLLETDTETATASTTETDSSLLGDTLETETPTPTPTQNEASTASPTPTATPTPTPTATPTPTSTDDSLLDDSEETLDNTTDSIDNTTENTTDTLDNTTDDTTDTVNETLDNTTETLDNTTDDTTDTVNETLDNTTKTLDNTTDAVNDTLDNTTESLDNTTDAVNDTLENTTNSTEETLNATLDNTTDAANETLSNTTEALDATADSLARANVTVRNASAGEEVSVDVSEADTSTIGVSTMDIGVERGGDFTLNVTAANSPLDGTPEYTRSDGGVGLANIRVDHTIADENISNVTFTFSLSEERLDARNATPDEVALYRYHDGEWNALETEHLRTEGDTHVFRAESPGLSDFTAAAQKPSFELAQALVDPEQVTVGETTAVRVRIKNVGDADGSYTAELLFDNETVATKQVTVAADGIRQVSFERTPDDTGQYEAQVNNVSAGTLAVEPANETSTATSGDGTTDTSAPGFGPVAAVVAVALVALRRR